MKKAKIESRLFEVNHKMKLIEERIQKVCDDNSIKFNVRVELVMEAVEKFISAGKIPPLNLIDDVHSHGVELGKWVILENLKNEKKKSG